MDLLFECLEPCSSCSKEPMKQSFYDKLVGQNISYVTPTYFCKACNEYFCQTCAKKKLKDPESMNDPRLDQWVSESTILAGKLKKRANEL